MRIPTPVQRGAPVGSLTVDPLQPVFENVQFANPQETARNLGQLGEAAGDAASFLQTRRKDIDTRMAQARIDEARREINDPENGLFSLKGINARGAADRVDEIYEGVRGELDLESLPSSSRQAVEELLRLNKESAYSSVAEYELRQLNDYDIELSQARINGAAQDAATNPIDDDAYNSAYMAAFDAATMQAEQLYETDDPAYQQAITNATTAVVEARVNSMANTSPTAAQELLDAAKEANHIDSVSYDALTSNLQPEIQRENARTVAQEALDIRDGGGVTDPAQPVLSMIDRYESGSGGYSALYGQAQNSAFSGVDITTMTVAELAEFSQPSGEYGQWVKPRLDPNGYAAQNDLTSTPMGKYQIVGDTLRDLIDSMGLTGDEVFDEAMQDKMFSVLMQRRLDKATTPAGKREQLRLEWEGFRKATDAELDAAIRSFEGGGLNYSNPLDRINAEEDIDVRQLARQYYDRDVAAADQQQAREKANAIDSFYAQIDSMNEEDLAKTSWETLLTREQREFLGTDLTHIENWYNSRVAGKPIETDEEQLQELQNSASGVYGVRAQADFMDMNLTSVRAVLSDQDYRGVAELQRQMRVSDQDPDLPSITDVTPSISDVSAIVDSKLKETGFVPADADAAAYRTQLIEQTLKSMQLKGLQQKGFTGWTDLDYISEIELQSVRITIDDGRGGLDDVEAVPLFQVGVDLGNQGATAESLVAAAQKGTLAIGEYVISPEFIEQAKADFLDEYSGFQDVYAEDLIEYIYDKLRQSPQTLVGVTTLADRAEAAAMEEAEAAAERAGAQADFRQKQLDILTQGVTGN